MCPPHAVEGARSLSGAWGAGHEGSTLGPKHLPEAPPPNAIALGIRLQRWDFGDTLSIVRRSDVAVPAPHKAMNGVCFSVFSNLGWTCEWLQSIGCHRSDIVWVLGSAPNDKSRLPTWPAWPPRLQGRPVWPPGWERAPGQRPAPVARQLTEATWDQWSRLVSATTYAIPKKIPEEPLRCRPPTPKQ